MPTEVLILEKLGCANCAAKIEAKVLTLPGIEQASVDFISKKLRITADESRAFSDILADIETIVASIEPDVIITVENATSQRTSHANLSKVDHGSMREITRLVTGGILFVIALIFALPAQIELALYLTSYIIVGGTVLWRAIKGTLKGQFFSEHSLMSIATIGAFILGQYSEGVAVMLFYLVGELVQESAVGHSKKSISALIDLRPDYAHLQEGSEMRTVSPEEVRIGQHIIVKPGERIPLDGVVRAGSSMVDTAALTGESMHRHLTEGSEALSGFVNIDGVLTIEVVQDFKHSTVSKILDLVENATSKKAPTEKFLTKFARYYTPAVVYSALALALIPPHLIEGATLSTWTYRALVFLVVSCPCALVISIPLGFFGGIGGASKRGILVKGSVYLEALNDVDTVVFDKTGTLTQGIFAVSELHPSTGYTDEQLLRYAAYAESYSNHPIARSITSAYPHPLNKTLIANHQEVIGYGATITLDDKRIIVGNARFMERNHIVCDESPAAGTWIHVAAGADLVGSILLADQVKTNAREAIRSLSAVGVNRTVMLTGDSQQVGEAVAAQLGVDEVYAELLPADKVERLEELEATKTRKGALVFVGDGINDAPVLARANVGIAMGGLGSDAAIEAADIVIMDDDPAKVAIAIAIAQRTRRIVYQNIVFALGVKAVFLVLGAFGLASMWEAVFADMGVALLAIVNAMRVMNTKNI